MSGAAQARLGTPILFGERAIPVILPVKSARFVRALLSLARALEVCDRARAAALAAEITDAPALEGASEAPVARCVSPTLRAQALARVLLDLTDGGWRVVVDDGQILLVAPRFRAGAQGLMPDEVRAEKERVRASLAPRVREQLERPATRSFILDQERAHFTADGPRSILNLMAEGPRLAAALRERGASAIQPYVQPADGDAGRDQRTGLRLSDIFRYFRYTWSFPFGSTPGRTLPLLIRDAGQPSHPVCGLLCLSSAVPRLVARDAALGWTPAWLEAAVAALDTPSIGAGPYLAALELELRRRADPPVDPAALLADVAALLDVEAAPTGEDLGAAVERLGAREGGARLKAVRARLCADLSDEIEDAIRGISLHGLGTTVDTALEAPARALKILNARADKARARWRESRKIAERPGPIADRLEAEHLQDESVLRRLSSKPLFEKKRVTQAAQLLIAWQGVWDLRGQGRWERLRDRVLGRAGSWRPGEALSGGERVARGLRAALLQRQGRLLASRVADLSVCGALPPYGPLLGGKLAALVALSRAPAQLYYQRYAEQVSEIGSQMAARAIVRPADLVALTTTSFYGVGSSQYERVRLPGGPRWRLAGYSAGHGTLQFAAETTALLNTLLRTETGLSLITSTFGEGPSERMRKVRDGLAHLGLDVTQLLQHGMPRLAYIADLGGVATRPGARPARAWRLAAPDVDAVSAHWRERWLGPRLARSPGVIDEVATFVRENALLSRRLVPTPPAHVILGGTE
jgi:hypothetical protein